MNIIGRKKEIQLLDTCLHSGRPEFVAVYGRRRVGKTYLIREYFKGVFSFYATGIAGGKTRDQLKAFNAMLREHGCPETTIPPDWFEAFARLVKLLESGNAAKDRASGRTVVFLDELPWLDTARSDFKAALEFFWNSWASARPEVMLIVCGSATSWIISNLVNDRGGFHNRLTRQIALAPFTLAECEEFYQANGIGFTRQQMIESYLVFGGIPYYLNLIDRRSSLAQNIDQLCFDEAGPLRHELERLLSSLFKHASRHEAIIRELAGRKRGRTRAELERVSDIGGGQPLTKALAELVQCGFVREYRDFSKRQRGRHYQLIDPFTLFGLRFLESGAVSSWMAHINSPGYYAWRGNAFEIACLIHVRQIKDALGISGVETSESAWRSTSSDPGAQVDLVIDRADGIVDLCETKFSDGPFAIDKGYDRELRNKLTAFAHETGTRKAVHLVLITPNGLARNKYWGTAQADLAADALFRP